jgi:hypothetical protein
MVSLCTGGYRWHAAATRLAAWLSTKSVFASQGASPSKVQSTFEKVPQCEQPRFAVWKGDDRVLVAGPLTRVAALLERYNALDLDFGVTAPQVTTLLKDDGISGEDVMTAFQGSPAESYVWSAELLHGSHDLCVASRDRMNALSLIGGSVVLCSESETTKKLERKAPPLHSTLQHDTP